MLTAKVKSEDDDNSDGSEDDVDHASGVRPSAASTAFSLKPGLGVTSSVRCFSCGSDAQAA